jgi:hypothetical protein
MFDGCDGARQNLSLDGAGLNLLRVVWVEKCLASLLHVAA